VIYWFHTGLLLRIAGAAVVSYLIVMALGPTMIRFLIRKKMGDRPEFNHADLNELTRSKGNTPTMGGILIVISVGFSTMLFANLGNMYIRMGLFGFFCLGILGGVDDWMKLRHSAGQSNRDGLRSWQKILFQICLAVLIGVFMYRYGSQSQVVNSEGIIELPSHQLYLPFVSSAIYLPLFAYVLIVIATMVGASNAVNLTDGMDGLAPGCVVITTAVFLLLAWIAGVQEWSGTFHLPLVLGAEEMTILCASILGACIGFLWYNANPAQVFMGDTGSLPLGGLLGFIAIVIRQESLLVIAGGVFVMETMSVILQVGYFKITRRRSGEGKRLFRIAPIHHHFHLGGWAEPKVVVRFWLMGIIFAVLALATLKLR